MHVCCVCGPLVPVSLLQLTGWWQSGADTNPLYSLSECDGSFTACGALWLGHFLGGAT